MWANHKSTSFSGYKWFFLASWTTNIIQIIFESKCKISMRNYKIIMLHMIFGKVYGSVLEKWISQSVVVKGIEAFEK